MNSPRTTVQRTLLASPQRGRTRSRAADLLGDPILATVLIGLVPIGLLMVGSASFVDAITTHNGQPWYYLQRQMIGGVLGLGLAALGLRTPYRAWHRHALTLMVVVLGLLTMVLL